MHPAAQKVLISGLAIVGLSFAPPARCKPVEHLSPEATVHQAFNALATNRPEQLFDLMPSSYQADIERIVIDFAKHADPGLWNQARGMTAKLSGILTLQQDLLVRLFAKQTEPDADQQPLRDGIAALATMTAQLADSRLTDLEHLKTGQLRALLATDGHALMQSMETVAKSTQDRQAANMWSKAQTAKVELLEADEERALVQTVVGDETEQVKLVRVEGRWVPEEMAQEWAQSIADSKKKISAMDLSTPEGQQQAFATAMTLRMIDGFLDQIKDAKTEQDIETIMGGLMMGLMLGGAK